MDVKIPEGLWADDNEGIISTWLYADGDQIAEGAVVAELMVEKVTHDLVAEGSGILKICVSEESPVKPGMIVAKLK